MKNPNVYFFFPNWRPELAESNLLLYVEEMVFVLPFETIKEQVILLGTAAQVTWHVDLPYDRK